MKSKPYLLAYHFTQFLYSGQIHKYTQEQQDGLLGKSRRRHCYWSADDFDALVAAV